MVVRGSRVSPSPDVASLLLLLAFPLIGCSDANRPSRSAIVTDSAGIRITVSPDHVRPFATIDSIPVFTLGGPDAEGPTQFAGIRGIFVDPRGTIWVADNASAQVRLFDQAGAHVRSVGGRGEGPGEFQLPRPLGAVGDGSVLVTDDRLGRVTHFTADGEYIRDELTSTIAAAPRLGAVLENGDFVGQIPNILQAGSVSAGTTIGDSARFVRWRRTPRDRIPFATAPAPTWIWDGRYQVPIPFTTNPGFAVDRQIAYLTTGSDFVVRAFDESGPVERFGVARSPGTVDGAAREAYREYVDLFEDSSLRAAYLAAMERPETPSVLPSYSDLLLSEAGEVWAQRYLPNPLAASTWDVFGPDRSYLGEVAMPARFALRAVHGRRAIGIWLDDFNVEYVRAYRLILR